MSVGQQASHLDDLCMHQHRSISGDHTRTVKPQVLPISDAKKNQKVAVGDLSGVLQVFSIKRGELAIAFKTLPSAKVRLINAGVCHEQAVVIYCADVQLSGDP